MIHTLLLVVRGDHFTALLFILGETSLYIYIFYICFALTFKGYSIAYIIILKCRLRIVMIFWDVFHAYGHLAKCQVHQWSFMQCLHITYMHVLICMQTKNLCISTMKGSLCRTCELLAYTYVYVRILTVKSAVLILCTQSRQIRLIFFA